MGGCPRCGSSFPNATCGRCSSSRSSSSVKEATAATRQCQAGRRDDVIRESDARGRGDVSSATTRRGRPADRRTESRRVPVAPRDVSFPESDSPTGATSRGAHQPRDLVSSARSQPTTPRRRLEYLDSLREGIASLREEGDAMSSRFRHRDDAQPSQNGCIAGRSAATELLIGARGIQDSICGLSARSQERNRILRQMLQQQRRAATSAVNSGNVSSRASETTGVGRPPSARRPSSARPSAAAPEAYHRPPRSPAADRVARERSTSREAAHESEAAPLSVQGQQHMAQRRMAEEAAEAEERRRQVQAYLAAQETAESIFSRLSHLLSPELNAEEAEALGALTLASATAVVANRKEDSCAICLDTMTVGEDVRMLGCGHRFHQPCLRKWVVGKSECVCPMCRLTSKPS